MSISFIALTTVALINVVIGSIVLLRNPREKANIAFLAFVAFVALWAIGLAFFSEASEHDKVLYWSKIYYIAATGIATSLYVFGISYLNARASTFKRMWPFILVSAVLTTLVAFVPSFLTREVIINAGANTVTLGIPEYFVYSLHFVTYFGLAVRALYKKMFSTSGIEKIQLKLVATGVLVAGLLGMYFNLILPWFDNYRLIWVGPQFSVVMVGFLAYGMYKHRLFDIRGLIVRSVVYLAVLATIATVYSAFVFGFLSLFINIGELGLVERIAIISSTVVIAFTYEPIRNFLNRQTNRLFYRDAYDSQQILDRLSSLLATEIELNKIVIEGSELLVSALRPMHMRFAVFKDGKTYVDHHLGTKSRKVLTRSQLNELKEVLVIRDKTEKNVKKILDHYEADVLLKLETNEETVGAILLGPKQSGTVYSQQDIDLLTISEKELAIAVQNARYFEQIQEFNIKLQEEIKEATSELRASNTKLKELDEAKDEFISMASHQLRTPLTSVKGYISMVMEGDAGKIKHEQKKLLEEAFASSQRMVYLIADLLNVSRLKTGKFVIEPAEVNLADLVEQEVSQLKPTARSRKLKLRFDKPSRFPKLWLDETKIRQVVMNFVDNAIYYTPAGGEINLSVTAKKDLIEFKVKDNGIGVPKEEQAKLFAKFYRAGNAKQARPDGTGLGLYMAQRVVSAQGGSIIFDSKEGQGSTFGFSFPIKSIKTKQVLLSHTQEESDRPGPSG